MHSAERTISIGERATELMRTYCETASPRSYELWFTYVSGVKPFLNEAMKSLLDAGRRLSEEEVDGLYDKHLSNQRLTEQAQRAGAGMLAEMEQVAGMIDTALGSAARYDASLTALTADLANPGGGRGLREILESLVLATSEVAATNRTLEARLKDSRGEIENLRDTLEQVRVESLIDPLTGIANRKHFEETLIAATEHAKRSGEALSLVVIDIDDFKGFNDAYGHLTGDQVLRLVSAVMHEHVEKDATLARFGGEEFAMILPNADRGRAVACAEKVRMNVEARELLKRSTGESLGRITISLGVAMLAEPDTATSLLERADHCMYAAKRAGRNRTVADQDGYDLERNKAA